MRIPFVLVSKSVYILSDISMSPLLLILSLFSTFMHKVDHLNSFCSIYFMSWLKKNTIFLLPSLCLLLCTKSTTQLVFPGCFNSMLMKAKVKSTVCKLTLAALRSDTQPSLSAAHEPAGWHLPQRPQREQNGHLEQGVGEVDGAPAAHHHHQQRHRDHGASEDCTRRSEPPRLHHSYSEPLAVKHLNKLWQKKRKKMSTLWIKDAKGEKRCSNLWMQKNRHHCATHFRVALLLLCLLKEMIRIAQTWRCRPRAVKRGPYM